MQLSVLDEQGKTIMTLMNDQLKAPGDYQMEVPVAGLPAGWYTVILQTKQGRAHQIMVKS